jgi:hypothetical protein
VYARSGPRHTAVRASRPATRAAAIGAGPARTRPRRGRGRTVVRHDPYKWPRLGAAYRRSPRVPGHRRRGAVHAARASTSCLSPCTRVLARHVCLCSGRDRPAGGVPIGAPYPGRTGSCLLGRCPPWGQDARADSSQLTIHAPNKLAPSAASCQRTVH